jgi:predicted nucleic acid-binding protein
MICFVDTSAFLAVLDGADLNHALADATLRQLRAERVSLVTTNYVVVELFSLAQRRLGLEAVRGLQAVYMPEVSLHWIDQDVHEVSIAALLVAARRQLSLVDCASFEVMRRLRIRDAFVFDPHFAEQGFVCHPT